MAQYQNGAVTDSRLIIGNYKVEVAAYTATTTTAYTNIGAGKVNGWKHNVTKMEVEAGNAPAPIEGIADETLTVDMEMIEFVATAISTLQAGILTATTVSGVTTINAGGGSTQTAFNMRLTNTRIVSGATHTTVITLYKVTADGGLSYTVKSDNDTDPINVLAMPCTAKIDGNRTIGSQLYDVVLTR